MPHPIACPPPDHAGPTLVLTHRRDGSVDARIDDGPDAPLGRTEAEARANLLRLLARSPRIARAVRVRMPGGMP